MTAIKKLYEKDEGATLARTIDTLLQAWGSTAAAVEGKLVEGLGLVFGRFNGEVDQAALVKKLAKYPGGAHGLLGNAKGLRDLRKATLSLRWQCNRRDLQQGAQKGSTGTALGGRK